MTTVEKVLKKFNVSYIKTWSPDKWKVTYKTTKSIIVEKITLSNKSTTCEAQRTLTESVHINGLFTPECAVDSVIEFLHQER